MRLNQKFSLLVVALALFASTLSASAQQSAQGKTAESATVALLQMQSQYLQTPAAQKPQLVAQFAAMAARRQQLLSSLMQTNPADVLRIAIPNNLRNAMPKAVQGHLEQSVTAQGVLEVLYEMQGTPSKTTGAVMRHYLQTSNGRIALRFAADPPHHLLTGSVVRVHGVLLSSDLALASGANSTSNTSLQTVSAASAPSTAGPVNTLVIMVNFQDTPTAQPWTASAVQNMVFTQTSNWDMENSFQSTWLTGDVAGWFTLPVASTNCDTGSIKSDALSAAQAAGYNLSNYSHYIYLMSSNTGCSAWWGLATVGGGDVWVNGQYNIAVHVFAHEMGHNFGLLHAHTVDCGTQVLCSSGTFSEYGDGFDTMGASTYNAPHFNAFHKEQLGWINNGAQPPITTVTSSGTYQLSPYETQDLNPKALKILQSGTTNSYYYAEFRQALGFDSFLSSYSDVMGGVVFHLASPSNTNSSDLLDMTATSPASFSHPALVAGQTYTDSGTGISVTPVSISSTGASVQVTMSTPACVPANPAVSVTPLQSAYVLAGTPVNFTVTVKDLDSSTCPTTSFNLTDTLPSGWSGAWNAGSLSLSPDGSGSATLTVTSPLGSPDGFYNVGIGTDNSSAASYGGSATATYVINTPAPVTVTVATDQSSHQPGQMVTVTVTMLSGTSPFVGGGVTVTVTSPKGKTATMTGTTGSNGTVSLSYKLNKRAPAGTYGVNANTSSISGGAATAGASTSFVVQ